MVNVGKYTMDPMEINPDDVSLNSLVQHCDLGGGLKHFSPLSLGK